jgi:hypothetical protein
MRRRPLLVASLLTALLATVLAPARQARAEGPTPPAEVWTAAAEAPQSPFDAQQATHWCWAATVANAFRLSGHAVSQARIVREVYGNVVNMRSGPSTNVSSLLDRAWTDDDGARFRARLMGVFDASAGRYDLDGRALVGALRAGRPLVIGTSSHAMLLIGASYETEGDAVRVVGATVFDPWPGVGVRALSPEEMVPVARGGQLAFIADVVVSR